MQMHESQAGPDPAGRPGGGGGGCVCLVVALGTTKQAPAIELASSASYAVASVGVLVASLVSGCP